MTGSNLALVISDCWGAYCNHSSQGYMHCTVNHSTHFVNPDTGAHTNTESTWRRAKVFFGQYNRGDGYNFHLAHMFAARCKAWGMPPFLEFLHLVANTDWSRCHSRPTARATRSIPLHLRNQVCNPSIVNIFRLEMGAIFSPCTTNFCIH
jgi:hypothetical protein